MRLNEEQVWLCEQIGKEWTGAITFAITRGPLDQLTPVYPRKCTEEYCVSHKQWEQWIAEQNGNENDAIAATIRLQSLMVAKKVREARSIDEGAKEVARFIEETALVWSKR